MSNQNLPKLFFFNIEPWKEVYNDRFLLKQLQEKGFPIEYVWIGPLVGLLSNVPSKGCETIPKSWKEIQRIINLDRNKDAILISLMPVFAPCLKLFRILSKAKQKNVGYFNIGSMHLPLPKNRMEHRLKLLFNPIRVRYYFIHRSIPLLRKIGYLKDFDYAVTQGVHSINSASQLISDKTQKITIVDYDIEHFNKVDKMERYNDRKYIVFIDAYMPFHPDFELTASGHIDPEQYFKSVNNYLKRVDDKYGLPVVIAAHPSAQKYHEHNYFDGRSVLFGKTAELCKGCAWAINHLSTAITFLIIQHKPIKFITTDEVVNKYGIAAELSYSSFFQSPLVNIDAEDADISVPVVFDSVYDEFIDKYLYTKDEIGKASADLLSEALLKIK